VDELTKAFLIKKFREYYTSSRIEMPIEFKRREWAFVFVENMPNFIMNRHVSFQSAQDFSIYVKNKIPAHIYYSSAYYVKPNREKMEDKGWIKADLIFDIDADHLPLKSKSYKIALNRAKKEVFKLYRALTTELGVDEKKIKIFFSGSRGYHIHVYDRDFQLLNSGERREIIDYLMVNTEKILDGNRFYDSFKAMQVSRILARYIKNLIKKGRLMDILKKYRVRNPERVYTILANVENLQKLENGDLSFLPRSVRVKNFVVDLVGKISESLRIYIDAPVTADVKRLIRMPNSLHGKTGLKVTEVDIDRLRDFNPFYDAVVFGDERVRIRGVRRAKIEIMGEDYSIKAGERASIPEHAAIFFLCRGVAVYGH